MANLGEKIFDVDSTFFKGVKSDCDPGQLPLGYAWTATNMINLGGVLSCRPGHRCIVTLPDGNLQGAAIFRPIIGLEQLLVAIDGVIYVSVYPFTVWTFIPNVQFSPIAEQIFWTQTNQSAQRINQDLTSPIEVIAPKAVMFMQDGGLSAPAWFDGSNGGHLRGNAFDTPLGGPMVWVGDRLWVAFNHQVFASDISDPFSFREQIYLGGVSSFFFSGPVTAMVKTPSIESPQLMVFTESNGSILQASQRDRNTWPTTVDFQREVVQVGCLSHRSAVSHYGSVVWFSPSGVSIFDPATSGKLTARLPVRDNEMMVSKTTLSEEVNLIAAGTFGQFLIMSVPAADKYNRHSWVLNHASLETLSDDSGPAWAGHWIGTRPVEWVSGQVADMERIYHVSVDMDGKNRLWESFRPERLDNGCPVTWAFESRAHFGSTAAIQSKLPGSMCRMAWGSIGLAGISEDLDLSIFYAGGTRGAYKQLLTKQITCARGSLSFDTVLNADSQIFAFKPQSRVERTEDANQQSTESETGSCGIERDDLEGIDESFQFLVVGHGPATVRWLRSFAWVVSEETSGEPDACVDETRVKALRFDGVGVTADSVGEAAEMLAALPERHFTSNRTALIEQSGFSAVGVGFAESIVSQQAADRVAEIIAVKQAESELNAVTPRVISIGEDF
jgi:hypothetical protein